MHKVGDKLMVKHDGYVPLVQVQSYAYKMDNIMGSDGFYEGDILTIAVIDHSANHVYLTYKKKIYFIKMEDIDDYYFVNIREQRREKLNKLFDNEQ